MRARAIAAAMILAAAAGCTGDHPLDGVKTAIEARPAAEGIVDIATARRYLQSYVAKNGANPASIEELEAAEGKLPRLPPGYAYTYDAATGTLDVQEPKR